MPQHNSTIKCPKCGFLRKDEFECIKCGIIFSKFIKTKLTNKENEYNFNNIDKGCVTNNKKFYFISVIYLLLILIDIYMVYDNEFTRPNRERLYSTVDLIEVSIINMQLGELKNAIADLRDRRVRTSKIIQYIEDECRKISGGVIIKRTNSIARFIFPDNSSFSYSAVTSNINVRPKRLMHETLFSFFPNLSNLHQIYKDIDYDSEVYELHSIYPMLDFSIIEEKYKQLSASNYYRLFIFAFIMWFFPMLLFYLIK